MKTLSVEKLIEWYLRVSDWQTNNNAECVARLNYLAELTWEFSRRGMRMPPIVAPELI